jgi:hypothetical protein
LATSQGTLDCQGFQWVFSSWGVAVNLHPNPLGRSRAGEISGTLALTGSQMPPSRAESSLTCWVPDAQFKSAKSEGRLERGRWGWWVSNQWFSPVSLRSFRPFTVYAGTSWRQHLLGTSFAPGRQGLPGGTRRCGGAGDRGRESRRPGLEVPPPPPPHPPRGPCVKTSDGELLLI